MKKILLIRPNCVIHESQYPQHFHEPLGLYYLKAYLEDSCEVEIFDSIANNPHNKNYLQENILSLGSTDEQIIEKISISNPDIIAISCMFTMNQPIIRNLCKLIRRYFPLRKIALGGTAVPDIDCDYKFIEDSETQFKKLVIDKAESFSINQKINRDIAIDYNKQYRRCVALKVLKLDVLLPISSLYNLFNRHKKIPYYTIITTRGCPNKCTFCAVHKIFPRYEVRDMSLVIEEVEELIAKGAKHIDILDDNFTASKKRVMEFCTHFKDKGISFSCPSGVYTPSLDREALEHLKSAGFNKLYLGIESGNQDVLDNIIKKNQSLTKIKEIIKICKSLKIETVGFFIFGLPGETKETMKDTYNFIFDSNIDKVRIYIYQPLPNTELYQKCVDNNYLKELKDDELMMLGNLCQIDTPTLKSFEVESFVGDVRNKLQGKGMIGD